MKILVIAPTPFFADRGTHIRILEESLALEKLGHKITLATYHIGRDVDGEVKTGIDLRRIRRWLFWYKKLEAGPDWQKIILDLMLLRKVFFLARSQKPDIIHAHLHEGVLIGWIVKKILFWRRMKLVADFHGSLTREMSSHGYLRGDWIRKIFFQIERLTDNLGDYAITSSWENTEEISFFRQDKKIETVLDGVNPEYYVGLPEKKVLKQEFELPSNKLIAVYAGALVENKGTRYLYQAIRSATEKYPEIFFVIGGFPIEEMRSFVVKENLKDRVRLISPLNYFDLSKILSACDVALDPKDSSARQASGKILQYMAAGLPVVCFDRRNNREYLQEGAYFSQQISAEGLVDGLAYFLKNKEERKSAGDFNKRRSRIFSWDVSAAKIESIYRNLLAE